MSLSPITKIKQQKTDGNWDSEIPLGATFENVRDAADVISLQDLYDSLMEASYIYQGNTSPSSSNVKVWYQTT